MGKFRFSTILFFMIVVGIIQHNLAYKEKIKKGTYQSNLDLSKLDWYASPANQLRSDFSALSGLMTGKSWMKATVPGTVLTTLLNNNKLSDPYFGLNNENITDANDDREAYKYWFVSKFNLTDEQISSHIWLNFRGINYKAESFINGRRANIDSMIGMFRRFSFEITELCKIGENVITVYVEPPQPAGDPNHGQGGDGEIARSVTAQYFAGWDWIKSTRDRSTGIWDKVYLSFTGPIKLAHLHIKTKVPGVRSPQTSPSDEAPVHFMPSLLLENVHAEQQTQIIQTQINYQLVSTSLTGSMKVSVIPYVRTSKVEFPEATLEEPLLWWPNTYGPQNLYTLRVELYYEVVESVEQEIKKRLVLSDIYEETFGFRNLTADLVEIDNDWGNLFFVNGQRIFIRGGSWIGLDAMMRSLNSDSYRKAIRHWAEMNLNMIRVWGGSIVERPEFYEECDRHGILVWQEFWITGDCNGAWEDFRKKNPASRRSDFPDSHQLFIDSARDAVLMLRNHPSLALWVGGAKFHPPHDINLELEIINMKLDSDRLYISSSLEGFGPGAGPYEIKSPDFFYSTRDENVFNAEIGSVGFPTVETIYSIMESKQIYPLGEENEVWEYHTFLDYESSGVPNQIATYGDVSTIEDYSRQAQIVNYVQYKSLMEGRILHMWDWYTGVLVWKGQNPWSGLRGQLYDFFGEQTGAYFGIKHACELHHVMLDISSNKVYAVNHGFNSIHVSARAKVYPALNNGDSVGVLDGGSKTDVVLEESSVKSLFSLDFANNSSSVGIFFVELTMWKGNTLYDEQQEDPQLIVSRNNYWITTKQRSNLKSSVLFAPLKNLLKPKVTITPNLLLVKSGSKSRYCVKLTITTDANPSSPLFSLRLMVRQEGSYSNSSRILPVYYQDNYITLMPRRTLTNYLYFETSSNVNPTVWMEGYNLPAQKVTSFQSDGTNSQPFPESELNSKKQCITDHPSTPHKCCFYGYSNEYSK